MSRRINDLEIIGSDGERIPVFKGLGAVEKFRILAVVLPPCGPIVIGVDKIFSGFVQRNVTTGFFLDEFIWLYSDFPTSKYVLKPYGYSDQRRVHIVRKFSGI